MREQKQAILVRSDLKMGKGKIAAQAAHAAVEAALKADKSDLKAWRAEGMAKIALKVNSKEELFKYQQMAKQAGLVTAVITDAGHTQVAPGTVTCMAIGPGPEETVDTVIKNLKLL